MFCMDESGRRLPSVTMVGKGASRDLWVTLECVSVVVVVVVLLCFCFCWVGFFLGSRESQETKALFMPH